jgi:hypothetical protein
MRILLCSVICLDGRRKRSCLRRLLSTSRLLRMWIARVSRRSTITHILGGWRLVVKGRRSFGRIDPKYSPFGRITIYRLGEGLVN